MKKLVTLLFIVLIAVLATAGITSGKAVAGGWIAMILASIALIIWGMAQVVAWLNRCSEFREVGR